MKKLSQRVAGLTPSITVGLILFAVGLTGLLAYRAFDASRAQQQVVEHTLRDYAGFAAFQLKNATIARIAGQNRSGADLALRFMNARPAPPPPSVRVGALMDVRSRQCRCVDSASFAYQVSFSDSAIVTTASEVATPANVRRIRDTLIAQALALALPDPPSPPIAGGPRGIALPSLFFVAIFSHLGGRPYAFLHTLVVDTANKPLFAYGYALPAQPLLGETVKAVLMSQPMLPTTLTRGVSIDSILTVKVGTLSRETLYESNGAAAGPFAATDSLEPRVGALRFEVAINPAAAGRLIIGGLPRSRLPEVLATAFVAVSLLGLLLYQFRRQEELGRLREDFVSGVSHELRTPLAQIRLLAELLRMEKVPTEEKKERSLRIIDQEARRLSFLVESILSFTQPQPAQLSPVRTEVAAEIEEIVCGFEPLAQAQAVRLTTRLERGIVANVDRGALRQVLLNLLDNAVRYGPPHQNVTITTASARDNWTLEVADEGPGIPADERERIFAPYYRMKRDAGGAVGGTGIGLAVVRQLVEQHGGRVHVVPAQGDGATGSRFVVALPFSATGAS